MKIFTYNRFRALLFNRYTLRKTTQKGNFEREILKYPMGPYKDEIATPTFEDVYGSEMKFSIGLVSIQLSFIRYQQQKKKEKENGETHIFKN